MTLRYIRDWVKPAVGEVDAVSGYRNPQLNRCARGAERSDGDIDAAIAIANAALPDYARVQRWLRADEAFSFHNDLLTANGRLRRAALAERYLARIGGADAGPAPFLPIEQEIDA